MSIYMFCADSRCGTDHRWCNSSVASVWSYACGYLYHRPRRNYIHRGVLRLLRSNQRKSLHAHRRTFAHWSFAVTVKCWIFLLTVSGHGDPEAPYMTAAREFPRSTHTRINSGCTHTTQHRTHCWLWLRLQSWLMPQSPHRLRNDLKCV